jgi:hypothetical protein
MVFHTDMTQQLTLRILEIRDYLSLTSLDNPRNSMIIRTLYQTDISRLFPGKPNEKNDQKKHAT